MLRLFCLGLLNLVIISYIIYAGVHWSKTEGAKWDFCDGFGMLLILAFIVYFFVIYYNVVKRYFGKTLEDALLLPIYAFYLCSCKKRFIRWSLYVCVGGALVAFLVLDTVGSRNRLISLVGLICLLVFGYVFSTNRSRIIWRPVIWGMALQFILGLLMIRWKVGRDLFQCIGDKVGTFLFYTNAGSSFVFSEYLIGSINVFAFQVLPVIFFFSLIIEIMFYWGAMQWICLRLGWCLQVTMGTTVCESVICAANTFLGMSESPLLIRPYISDLTKSEIHAIMTAGFATVSGTVLAAYISFGVQPAHLVTASVMSAPAALCYAKLFYPETDISKTSVRNIKIAKSNDTSVLDAASKGASNAIEIVLSIVANLVGFISLIAFINGVLGWLGMLVGFENLKLEWIFTKLFMPLSWIMGVPWDECEYVGHLIGLKTIVNEFVAYQKLGKYKAAGCLSSRSEAIATYALCGFTNPGSMGILVATMTALAPNRRSDFANIAIRALIAGCAVCFMTACVAGLLISPEAFNDMIDNNVTVKSNTCEEIILA